MIVVVLYHVFDGAVEEEAPVIVPAMVLYALCIMGFRYANFLFKQESRSPTYATDSTRQDSCPKPAN